MVEAENRENLIKCPVCYSKDFVFLYSKKDSKLEIEDRRLRCRSCSAIFIQNRLSPDFIIRKFYVKRNPIGPTEKYLRKKNHLKKIAERLEKFLPEGASVFDIGCGGGAFLRFMLDKGYKVSGLEVGEAAKEEAERVLGIKDVVRVGDFLETDFKDEIFDAVVLTDVIEHFHNPRVYLEKISSILKPGDLIIIRTPNSDSLMHRLLKSRWMLASPRHVVLYNRESTSFLLMKNSFCIIDFCNEKGIQGKFIPPFSYGITRVLKGFLINSLHWFFGAIGQGESITIFARKT